MWREEAWTDLAILAEEGLQISRSGRGGEAADPEVPASPCCHSSSSSCCRQPVRGEQTCNGLCRTKIRRM